jgi:VWFA-related protein
MQAFLYERKRTASPIRSIISVGFFKMRSKYLVPLICCVAAGLLPAADEEFVFRSDVALVRVDAQVVDRNNRPITGLKVEDFVLLENGKPQEIRNFAREEMPIDILLLLDVSGSMQAHVSRLASAASEALNVLGAEDRVAIMVFDRGTRVRLPFRKERSEIQRGLDAVLRQESFDGGTDITRGLQDAIRYVEQQARRDARRAIVILTDDQTERGADPNGVTRALASANTVLSALIAPDAMQSGRWGSGGGSWPSGGGGPLGGIILGRRGPNGGRYPGPVINGPRTQSAATSAIARNSGGESLRVDEASALETTLTRLRQRYALHFNLAEGIKPGQERVEVDLSPAARRRYPDADVRFHRVLLSESSGVAPVSSSSDEPGVISKAPPPESSTRARRRVGVSEDSSRSNGPIANPQSQGGWRRADQPEPAPNLAPAPPAAESQPAADEPQPKQGGWRRVKPGEQP